MAWGAGSLSCFTKLARLLRRRAQIMFSGGLLISGGYLPSFMELEGSGSFSGWLEWPKLRHEMEKQ